MPIPSVMFCKTRVLLCDRTQLSRTDFLGAHRDALHQHGNISLELAYFDLSRKRDFFEILILLVTSKLDFLRRCTWHHLRVHGRGSVTAAHQDRPLAQNERTPNRTQSSLSTVTGQSRGIEQTNRDSNMGVRASCPLHSEKSLRPTGLPRRPGRTRAERTDIHLEQQPLSLTGRRK